VILPITYQSNNKKSHYTITISTFISDSININDFRFYRNKKEIRPEYVYISQVSTDSNNTSNKSVISLESSNLNYIIFQGKYNFSFTFRMRKMTAKTIAIKCNKKNLMQVIRKKKLYHKIIFAS
jgi:hypothetical protein